MITIFNTYIAADAFTYINEVLESTMLSEGQKVREFEQKLRERGILNPIALNSGTSALHLAFILAGVKTGDEVILPAQTFVATGLAVLYCGATPVFADIDYATGNLDANDVERKITGKTKAICFVDWAGNMTGIDKVQELAQKHNLMLVEDAAHAFGAEYKGQTCGAVADITVFSFQAIKHVTTGDGGAIAVKSPALYDRAQKLKWFGIDRSNSEKNLLGERKYDISEPGFKYHMNNYAAAIGLANLAGFSERLEKRRALADYYSDSLSNISGINLFTVDRECKPAWWLFGMHVERREEFIRAMMSREIEVSVVHQRIDRNSCFMGKKTLPAQEKFDETQIHIPLHDGITKEKRNYIVDSIKKGW